MVKGSRRVQALMWAIAQGYTLQDGVVYLPSGKEAKLRANPDGYLGFTAGPGNGKERTLAFIHYWVAYLKFGEQVFESGLQIRHRDGVPSNNAWDNILLGTPTENMYDRPAEDRQKHAQKAADAQKRLSDEEVRQLRRDRVAGLTYRELRAKYKIPKSSISYILHGKTYGTVV